jgi:hypothetical protein
MAYPKTERKVVTVTIDESGDMVYLKTPESDIFMELGERITTRASHVEPYEFLPRLLFTAIRYFVYDDSKLAAWTRGWKCFWRVNTRPVGGPILTWCDVHHSGACGNRNNWDCGVAWWFTRESAIRAEVKFLNRFFLEGK